MSLLILCGCGWTAGRGRRGDGYSSLSCSLWTRNLFKDIANSIQIQFATPSCYSRYVIINYKYEGGSMTGTLEHIKEKEERYKTHIVVQRSDG